MTDLIIRSPYPAGDKLYPFGWRSFESDFISLNTYEVTREILSLNEMAAPLTKEVISINDITPGIIIKMVTLNSLEMFKEIVSLHDMAEATTLEIIAINILAAERGSALVSINDIVSYNGPYSASFLGINRIESTNPTYPLTAFSHTIAILIDNINVLDYVVKWQIEIEEESYVNSCSIDFANNYFFTQCDPTINLGEVRIEISIDDTLYDFFLEKRGFSDDPSDMSFNVWGRSRICLLDSPYAVPIFDKRVVQDQETGEWSCPDDEFYVPHIWQTADRMASEVIENVIGEDFILVMEIDDFVIKKDTFTVTNETPIEIANRIVTVVGGYIRTNLDGDVIAKYRKFNTTGSPVSTYTDLENIFVIDEDVEMPEGYNSILIRGPQDPLLDQSTGLTITLDAALNNDATTFKFGSNIWFRVYRSPFDLQYSISTSLGELFLISENVSETITREDAEFSDTVMKTDNPISTITSIEKYDCEIVPSNDYDFEVGYRNVTSEAEVKDEPVVVSYNSYYDLYKLFVNQPCTPLVFDSVISRIIVEETS